MTVLEARVPADQWSKLQQLFEAGSERLPPQMVRTLLVQSASDPQLWRGNSIWHSAEALQQYRASVETPEGVLFFRAVGTEPSLSRFAVLSEAEPR